MPDERLLHLVLLSSPNQLAGPEHLAKCLAAVYQIRQRVH